MAAKESFSQLTDRVNEAQAKVQDAASKDRAELQADVEDLVLYGVATDLV